MDFNTYFEITKTKNVSLCEARKKISAFLESNEDIDEYSRIQLEGLYYFLSP